MATPLSVPWHTVLGWREVQTFWGGDLSASSKPTQMLKMLCGPTSRDIAILSLRYPMSRATFSRRLALLRDGVITIQERQGVPARWGDPSHLPNNYPRSGDLLRERNYSPHLGGRGILEGILRDDLGEGTYESRNAARQLGSQCLLQGI